VSTFTTTLLQLGNNVGIEIPDAVVAELGGKRVPVVVTLDGGYSYRSTTAVMGGKNLVGLNAAHRAASGAAAAWDRLAYSHRKEHARAITEAKSEDTRVRRVAKAVSMLRGEA
jgi:hypothetical protein